MSNSLSLSKVNLFFDESGKNKDLIKTMGGLLIPDKIYRTKEICDLNNKLRENIFGLHWTDYNGGNSEKELYKNIITIFSKYSSLCSFNVIHYDYPDGMNKGKFDNMVYSKIPERIFYGLLRNKGRNTNLEAKVFIEDANVYKDKIKLHTVLKRELNNNAMYRGENFTVSEINYKHKNEEIGVELTDLFLGIVRVIIQNKESDTSKRVKNKNQLVVELLKNKNFYEFLTKIKYFEWNNSYELHKVDFKIYINNFLSNQDEWIEYLINNN